MKSKFLIMGFLIMTALSTVPSCKKDDDTHGSSPKIEGTFHAFEAQIDDGPVTPMPNEGENIDIQIKKLDKKTAKVLFIDFYQNNIDTIPFNCTIGKADDGSVVLNKKTSNGSVSVKVYDKNTVDLNILGDDQSVYVAASKDGKKPDWWE